MAQRTISYCGPKLEVKYKAFRYIPKPPSAADNWTTQTRRGYVQTKCRLEQKFDDEQRRESLYVNFNKASATGFVPKEFQAFLLARKTTTAEKICPATKNRYTVTVRPSVRAPGKYDFCVKGYQPPNPALDVLPEPVRDDPHWGWYLADDGPAAMRPGTLAARTTLCLRSLDTTHKPALPKSAPPARKALFDDYALWADKILNDLILVMAMDRALVLKLRGEQQMIECVLGFDKFDLNVPAQLAIYKDNLRLEPELAKARIALSATSGGGEMAEKEMAMMVLDAQDREEVEDSGDESWGSPKSGTSTGTTTPAGDTSGTRAEVQERRPSRATKGKKPAKYRDDEGY